MKRVLILLITVQQLLFSLDFTFATDVSFSSIGDPKIGLSMGMSDYQTRYKSGFSHGWGIGITTVGSGEPDKYYSQGVIVSSPSDIEDSMFWGEYRPLWRWHERNELYLMLGVTWNHITSHTYGYGLAYGVGYQYLFSPRVFIGGSVKMSNLLFNSGQEETEKYDKKYYQVYVSQVYMGFRF